MSGKKKKGKVIAGIISDVNLFGATIAGGIIAIPDAEKEKNHNQINQDNHRLVTIKK